MIVNLIKMPSNKKRANAKKLAKKANAKATEAKEKARKAHANAKKLAKKARKEHAKAQKAQEAAENEKLYEALDALYPGGLCIESLRDFPYSTPDATDITSDTTGLTPDDVMREFLSCLDN